MKYVCCKMGRCLKMERISIVSEKKWKAQMAPELFASTTLKNGQMNFLSTEIRSLAIRLVTSSIVSIYEPLRSKSLKIFFNRAGSFLASCRILDLTSLWRCFTVVFVTSESSFSGTYQVDSIMATKYSSEGVLIERSVQQSIHSSQVTLPSLFPRAPSKLLRNSIKISSLVFLPSRNSAF